MRQIVIDRQKRDVSIGSKLELVTTYHIRFVVKLLLISMVVLGIFSKVVINKLKLYKN